MTFDLPNVFMLYIHVPEDNNVIFGVHGKVCDVCGMESGPDVEKEHPLEILCALLEDKKNKSTDGHVTGAGSELHPLYVVSQTHD